MLFHTFIIHTFRVYVLKIQLLKTYFAKENLTKVNATKSKLSKTFSTLTLVLLTLTFSKLSHAGDWYKDFQMERVELYSPTFESNITFYKTQAKLNSPSLTLIHGVGGSAADFRKLIKQLSQDYQLFIPDLPGYGNSKSIKNTYLPSKYAQALSEVMPSLVKSNNIVIGHSMGGNISVQLSLNHPELAQKLILIDAAGFINKFSYSQYLANNYAVNNAQLTDKEAPLLKGLINTINKYIPDPTKVLLSDVGREYLLGNNSTYISAISVLDENLTKLMRKPAPPTHIIWGGKDMVMPVQVIQLLSYLLKTQSIDIYETAGHSPQKEFPIQVANSIHNFIQSGVKNPKNIDKIVIHDKNIIINCDNNQNADVLNNAVYLKVTIKNCQLKNTINNLSATQLIAENSNITLTNLNLDSPNDFSFVSLESDLNIWGGTLKGLSIGYIEDSNIEIHGADIYTKNTFVISNVPTTMNVSVTRVHQSSRSFSWHGIVSVGL